MKSISFESFRLFIIKNSYFLLLKLNCKLAIAVDIAPETVFFFQSTELSINNINLYWRCIWCYQSIYCIIYCKEINDAVLLRSQNIDQKALICTPLN